MDWVETKRSGYRFTTAMNRQDYETAMDQLDSIDETADDVRSTARDQAEDALADRDWDAATDAIQYFDFDDLDRAMEEEAITAVADRTWDVYRAIDGEAYNDAATAAAELVRDGLTTADAVQRYAATERDQHLDAEEYDAAEALTFLFNLDPDPYNDMVAEADDHDVIDATAEAEMAEALHEHDRDAERAVYDVSGPRYAFMDADRLARRLQERAAEDNIRYLDADETAAEAVQYVRNNVDLYSVSSHDSMDYTATNTAVIAGAAAASAAGSCSASASAGACGGV